MSSWFWLNTERTRSCWTALDENASKCIENKYKNGETTQLAPFYLPTTSMSNISRRVRLLPNVNVPMAVECNQKYPLICVTNKNKNTNNKIFGYNININLDGNEEQKQVDIINPINNNIEIELITQRIIFLNQEIVAGGGKTKTANDDKWYCLGIGHTKNMWYPFDVYINQTIDEYFNQKQESFKLEEGSPSLNIRFGRNAFSVAIPYGFIVNNNNNNNLLIIKYRFDFFGLIHGLNVSLNAFNGDRGREDEVEEEEKTKEISRKRRKRSVETQSDCITFCNILYGIFDEQQEIDTYNDMKEKIKKESLDGIALNKCMQLAKKEFITKIYLNFKLLKKGPASKLKTFLINNINNKYMYAYNYDEILSIISTISIGIHFVIREFIIANKYTVDAIINNNDSNQILGNIIHGLSQRFKQNKKTKANKKILSDQQLLITEIKKELLYYKFSNTLIRIIFGDDALSKQRVVNKLSSNIKHNYKVAIDDKLLINCDIYLSEVRQEMLAMLKNNNDVIYCYELCRYKEIKRVKQNILSLKYDEQTFADKKILENDKSLQEFLNSGCKIRIDETNHFILQQIKVQLKNDINNWLCCVFYKEYEILRLKESLRLLILNDNITSTKLNDLQKESFAAKAHKNCGKLMSIKLGKKLFQHLPNQKNTSPKNCEEIYNQTIQYIDKWWNDKKKKLKKKCIALSLDKQSFISYIIPNKNDYYNNNKTWPQVINDLKQMVDIDDEEDEDDDFDHDFSELITAIRLCTDNDIQKENITFGEWLLNLLQDFKEFEDKMIKLRKYIIGKDINADKLNKQIIKRKDFATKCDECDIARGVSTKLHKELTKRTDIKKDWSSTDVFNFMKEYLQKVTKTKKIKIIEKIKREKIGKHEFIEKYAFSGEESMNKIHDFLRNKMEYTKKEQTLKQMSHRIYSCIGLYNNMYTENIQNLTGFNQEYKEYERILSRLTDPQKQKQKQQIKQQEEEIKLATPATLKQQRAKPMTHVIPSSNAFGVDMTGYFHKDIRQLIAEYIYTKEKIKEQIDLMKSYVLKNNIDSNIMVDTPKKKLCEIMKSKCKIAPGITTNLLKKVIQSNEFGPNQMVDFISDHLHEFRNKKLKEIQDCINRHYPIGNGEWSDENKFIDCIIKDTVKLRDLLAVKLRKYVKNNTDLYISQILKEINDRDTEREKENDIHIEEKKEKEKELPEREKDFISYLVDLAYGSDSEWKQQQKEIRNFFIGGNIDIKQMKKVEFSKKMLAVTQSLQYPNAQSGKLYKKLLNQPSTDDLCDIIISEIDSFRNKKREKVRKECMKANITKNSWSSKKEGTEFLSKTLKLKHNQLKNVIIKLFGSIDDDDVFADWLCDVIYNKNDLNKLNSRIGNYFNNNTFIINNNDNYKTINDFKNWFNISIFTANNLYQQIIKTLKNTSSFTAKELIEISCNYLSDINQINKKDIVEKCKNKNINNHKLFIDKYGDSIENLMFFLKDILELKLSNANLLLIGYKLHFYVNESYKTMKDIFTTTKQFILWQSKLICFVKAVKCSMLLSICINVQGYDGKTLLSMKSKPFCKIAETFGVVKGPAVVFYRNVIKETKNTDTLQVIVNKISKLIFTANVEKKKFDNLIKKGGEDTFIQSINEINVENISGLIADLNQKELNNKQGSVDIVCEMNLCLRLFKMDQKKEADRDHHADADPDNLKIARDLKIDKKQLDLQSLNEMNSRQIAFVTCNVIMKRFVVQFEQLRADIITKYNKINGAELYKLYGDNENENKSPDLDLIKKLQDVSYEEFALIACECLKKENKYSHKIKLLVRKINDLNLDGKMLFEKALVGEESFIEEISNIMKSSAISAQSMKLIYQLMYRNKLEWMKLTTDEFIDYALKMCLKNVSDIIINTKLTGKKFMVMGHTEFANTFLNHPFKCCLASGPLLQLCNSIKTYSFDSDCKYKDFVENDLCFGNSSLGKLIISDFEKAENHQQLKNMNNNQLARWISSYPINQLYDILIFYDINNAETLHTQLNSSLLDDVCGFSHFIGGRHSKDMIKNYWIQIASSAKQLIINDFSLILQLQLQADNYTNTLFELDKQNKTTLHYLLNYSNEIKLFLQEKQENELWQTLLSFIQNISTANKKFKQDWNEYEIASFLLSEISTNVELSKNTKNTLLRMNNYLFTPYEILLALNDFKPFIKFLISNKLNAKQLFDLDKKGELIRTLKDNKKCINDQTGDIYIIWIKEKLLRLQYINIAKKGRQMFTKHQNKIINKKKQLKLQEIISKTVYNQQLSFNKIKKMQEKEFIDSFGPHSDLKIYNLRCCKSILKEIKNESSDKINQLIKLKTNQKVKWFANYEKDKIYHILYSKKFTYKFFSNINEENLNVFYEKVQVLSRKESDILFNLLNKEYLRLCDDADQKEKDNKGLPSIFNPKNYKIENDYYCNGSCHDGYDTINVFETSFSQLLLFILYNNNSAADNYINIKQLWYNQMYKTNPHLFNHLDIINGNTFDQILFQIIENDTILTIILNTFDAFNNSTFIKQLTKYNLTESYSAEIIISFLMKIIKNINHIFEAKYLFYSILNASCRGREQYDFDNDGNHLDDDIDDDIVANKYFTFQEHKNIEQYLSNKNNKKKNNNNNCSTKYYLRSLLSAIIRVSNETKKNTFSSIDNNKPKTIYLPSNDRAMKKGINLINITPTMRYKTSLSLNHCILLRLQSSSSYFGTHFIDLNDREIVQSTNVQQFDGYLFCPFNINEMVQTRLKIKDPKQINPNPVIQYQCTDINSIYLDKLCPYLSIQQYSNKYFVLFQIYSVLGHNKFILLDNKYISFTNINQHIFIEKVQKQTQNELELFLSKKCNLNQSDINKIMISTDKFNQYNCSLSNFLYIDGKTLQSMGINNESIQEQILKIIQQKRKKFYNNITNILIDEFPDLESIIKALTDRKIATFDHNAFYDEKYLEQFIANSKQRYLLLHSKCVLKCYFKKAYFNFISTKKILNNLYNNQFNVNSDLKQIFGILYDTFNKIKNDEMNIIDDDDDDDADADNKNENENDDDDDGYDEKKDNTNNNVSDNYYNSLLNGINQLTLNENTTSFDLIFLPNFSNITNIRKEEIDSINCLLTTYVEMKYNKQKEYKTFDDNALSLQLMDAINIKETNENNVFDKVRSFVLIKNTVIGYINDERTEKETEVILNCSIDTFSSYLQTIQVYLNDDNKRCAKLLNNNKSGTISSTINSLIYSDKQQNLLFDSFINILNFELAAKSIQSRCCLDIQNNKKINLTDPMKEWFNCDYCIYDIVQLNTLNLSLNWRNNHKCLNVDDDMYGIVTQIELATNEKQKQYHLMIINELYKLLNNDILMKMFGDDLNINNLCNQQSFVWNIENKLKFTHRALQFITIEWHTNNGKISRGIYPNFGHIPFLTKIENIPRLFDVVIYDNSLFYVYSIQLKHSKKKPNIALSIIRYNIGNNADLTKNMMQINYSKETIQIVTQTLYKWKISRYESIWYLPIYLNDYVIRAKSKLPGKIIKIFRNGGSENDNLSDKLPLINVEVDWLIKSKNSQNIFVWLGIGNILLNKQFKYRDYMIYNELYLASIECNDRVCRGMDWDEQLFGDQDHGNLLGKVSKIEPTLKGGYELMVEWDNKEEYNYRFGLSSFFDVNVIQRRSKCYKSNIVPIFCGDKILRSISWKWADQDSAVGFDENNMDNNDNNIICPQIGIVREIYNNNNGNNDNDNDRKMYNISDYINNIPIDDDFENDTLILIDWINNKYDKHMKAQEIIKINDIGLYDYEIRHCEKYRYGFENAFDVTIIGQHASIPIIPYNKIINNNNFYINYTRNHLLNIDQMNKAKDILYYTFYKSLTMSDDSNNNQNDDEFDRYQKELLTSRSNQWPPIIVNKLNEGSDTFLSRFVDITKFIQ